MIIEVVSHVAPLHSTSNHDQEVILKLETVELISFVTPIVATLESKTNFVKQLVEVDSHVNAIYGDIFVPKRQTIEVISYIAPIVVEISQETHSKKIEGRTVVSYANGIQSDISISLIKIPVTYLATVSYTENPSYTEVRE